MPGLMRLVASFGLLAALAGADPTGSAEVDLVFPRNDTFEPMPLMPLVFAIQNPAAIGQLYPSLDFTLTSLDSSNKTISQSLDFQNVPNNETTSFLYTGIPNFVDTEGTWQLVWYLTWINCSTSEHGSDFDGDDELDVDWNGFHKRIYRPGQYFTFTTRKGGSQPDLTAISTGEGCGKTQALAFDVKEILKVPSALSSDGVTSCALLASPAPTPSPCQASVESDTASSISARITHAECHAETPAVSCPPEEDGATVQRSSASILLAAGSAWLLQNLVY